METTFTFERETKNAVRYNEDGDPADHKIGTLYVKKRAFPNGAPQHLKVTVEEVA